jgi:hypothetical protein
MIWNWRKAPAPDPKSPLGRALAELDAGISSRPELAEPGKQLREMLAAAFGIDDVAPLAEPDRDALIEGWMAGRPSFLGDRGLDPDPATRRIRAISRLTGPLAASGDLLAWLDGTTQPDERRDAFYRLTWLPTLAPLAARRTSLMPAGLWERPECPNCGRGAILMESRGLEQRRFHRCGLCATSWPAPRLGGPGCLDGRSDRVEIRYLEEEKDRRRIEHCNACGSSWKVLTTLGDLSPPGLIVADFLSIHLDLLIEQIWPIR